MSIETWKKEFYKESIEEVCAGTTIAALEHTLTMFKGCRPASLSKHQCHLDGAYVKDAENKKFILDCEHSYLCNKFTFLDVLDYSCMDCPLCKVRGGVECDQPKQNRTPPWWSLTQNKNPEPMIDLIKKAIKIELAN